MLWVQRSPSVQPAAGLKRKERDFDRDTAEDTNIRVVVRCRGRSDREVKENSGVVVCTEGIKGKTVELSMGPNALGNKAYHFDKVFSPAADQAVIYEDVVIPILNEVYTPPDRLLSHAAANSIIRFSRAIIVPYLHMDKPGLAKHTLCRVT